MSRNARHGGPLRDATATSLLAWLAVAGIAGCAAVRPPPSRAEAFVEGPYPVAHRDYLIVNAAPPVDGDRTSPSPRVLRTRVWFPRHSTLPHPLVVYSHGYYSTRLGGTYLAETLASRGYVVAAPDHPLTRRWGPQGPRADDVVNQPGDVHAVVEAMLGWSPAQRPFRGSIDADRVGVMGLSLGGMTATLAAFHPALRDPRIAAAVSLAGPMTIFDPRFFARVPVAFLMVAGDEDVVIEYRTNAPLVTRIVPGAALVTLAGASHAGFDDAARLTPSALGNPDRLACWWLAGHIDLSRTGEVLRALGAPDNGMIVPEPTPRPCREAAPARAMDPLRQQLVTRVVVAAFFDSRFAADPAARRAAAEYLERWLPVDFPEATYRRSSARASVPPSSGHASPGDGAAQTTSPVHGE